MTLSRWKMMAVGLGVSLGGLAAMAGQCPKSDPAKGRTAEAPPALEVPAIPAAPPKSTPPATPAVPDLPPLPAPGGVAPAVLPVSVPDTPPPLPTPSPEPVKKPDAPVSSPATPPVLPAGGSEAPKPDAIPPLPGTPSTAPATPPMPQDPPRPTVPPAPRASEPLPDVPPATGSPTRAGSAPSVPTGDPLISESSPATRPSTPVAQPLAVSKYRILLRVGEGEPSFEVKCGDDLVLKVVCEKVDIKSPEKGSGPSMVTARGKVRFAGFGAEGVCGELSFVTGTGEVKLGGDVNIKVKDKLGRVESEFSTASVTYKLDPSAGGSR